MSIEEQANAIVGKLTERQRKALLLMAGKWESGPTLADVVIDQLVSLRELDLVERQFGDVGLPETASDDDGVTFRLRACWWFRLVPLGLAVRNLLSKGGEG